MTHTPKQTMWLDHEIAFTLRTNPPSHGEYGPTDVPLELVERYPDLQNHIIGVCDCTNKPGKRD